MWLAGFGFYHIGFVAGCEDEVAFVFAAVEVEAFYIMAGVAQLVEESCFPFCAGSAVA